MVTTTKRTKKTAKKAPLKKSQKEKVMAQQTETTVQETAAKAPQKYNVMTKKVKAESKKAPAKQSAAMESSATISGITKEYLGNKNICKTTFRLPVIAAPNAKRVYIVGDFNNWSINANRMKKHKNGAYTVQLDLEPGREYHFRYLIDENKWENDWKADKYVKSPYGDSDNSVVVL